MKHTRWRLVCAALLLAAGPGWAAPELKNVADEKDLQVFVRLRYATPRNFTGKTIYDFSQCYLHPEVISALKKAVRLAARQKEPFTFCLWDCYRPPYAQQKLWQAVPNPSYVAPPKKGSRHTRAMAVDLTPCDFQGNPLPMPTDFDDFSPRAHMDFYDLPPAILERREALKKIMTAAGFTYTRTEWWHFDKTGWKEKPLLDFIPPKSLPSEKRGGRPKQPQKKHATR